MAPPPTHLSDFHLLVIHTGRTVFEKEAFKFDGSWNIAALVYFICYGFAYIFASAKPVHDNPSGPTYFKIRPTGPTRKSWRSTLGYGGQRAGQPPRQPNSAPRIRKARLMPMTMRSIGRNGSQTRPIRTGVQVRPSCASTCLENPRPDTSCRASDAVFAPTRYPARFEARDI